MKSYLKFLSRNALYTAIEAVGLIVSLAFVILIGSYVRQQWQVAKGAPEWKHYYAVGTSTDYVNMVPNGLPDLIKDNVPGVDKATLYSSRAFDPSVGDVHFHNRYILRVEPDFFEMFSIPWTEGSEADLNGDYVAVSERILAQLGPADDVIGRRCVRGKDTLSIAAVFKNIDTPLFEDVDFLRVMEPEPFVQAASGGTSCLISSSMPEKELKATLNDLYKAQGINQWSWDDNKELNGSLVRMDQLYFSELNRDRMGFHKGNRSLLTMLTAVVLLLLLSAVFNYINLSAALAGKRIKEMGMRSILGASRGQIVKNLLAESLLFTVVCAALSILLAHFLTPILVQYVETKVLTVHLSAPFSWQWDFVSVGALVLLVLVLGLLAGWIPARIVTAYDPVQIVKGDYRVRNKRLFSKCFIVFQSALAVMLLSFALVLEHQFSHMLHRPLGANVDNLYYQFLVSDAHADAVEQLPFVAESGRTNGYPGQPYFGMSVTPKGASKAISLSSIECDPTAFEMYRFEKTEDFQLQSGAGVWISESAIREMDIDPAHPVIPDGLGFISSNDIAGYLKDFAITDAAHVGAQDAGVVVVNRDVNSHYLVLRITGDHKEAEKTLKALYTRFSLEQDGYEGIPELSGFIQDKLKTGLDEARNYMRLMELFMGLAILVSLLGLLAMSAFFASEQTRDIAVRKVFGGTVGGEVMRGVGAYMLLVTIACILAVPVAVWLSGRYLEGFNYRISGYDWIFAVAVVIALLISFASVLWQTLRAARTDPAVELKKE